MPKGVQILEGARIGSAGESYQEEGRAFRGVKGKWNGGWSDSKREKSGGDLQSFKI